MVDWWKKYGIVIAKKHAPKWHKVMLKIKKYKKDFAKRELELEKEIVEQEMKKLQIIKFKKQLKRKKLINQNKSPIESKLNKIYEELSKSLKQTLLERINTAKKFKKLTKQKSKLTPRWRPKSKAYSIRPTNAKHWRHKFWRDSFISELQLAMEYETRPQMYKKATEQLFLKMKKDEEALDRINTKIIQAINDIREMDALIDYIKKGDYDRLKLKPFNGNNGRKATSKTQEVGVEKNTDKLDELGAKDMHEDVFNFQSDYILKHIPELQPSLYGYLTDNTARKHKRKKTLGKRRSSSK